MIHLAVIGHPIAHSLSPVLHRAAAAEVGVQIRYDAIDVPPEALADALDRLRDDGFVGFNVTAPHKRAVHDWAARLTDAARAVGAVNTVAFDADGALGDNTDAAGLAAAIDGAPPGRAVVLGAGGGAPAGRKAAPAGGVGVVGRSPASARGTHPRVTAWDDARDALRGAALLVNCTSRAAAGAVAALPLDLLAPEALVHDMNYGDAAEPVRAAARATRRAYTDGLAMLVHQGLAAFRRWTGVEPPFAPVFAAVRGRVQPIDTPEARAVK